MWHESWDLITESTTTPVAQSSGKIYYHGFFADTTGTMTHLKFRVREASYVSGSQQITIRGGLYSSNNNDSSPQPTTKLGEGSINLVLNTSLIDDQIVEFNFQVQFQ